MTADVVSLHLPPQPQDAVGFSSYLLKKSFRERKCLLVSRLAFPELLRLSWVTVSLPWAAKTTHRPLGGLNTPFPPERGSEIKGLEAGFI